MPRDPNSRAYVGLLTFQALFQPEIEHVIEFEQTVDLIIYADTSEPVDDPEPDPPEE
ncbi:MAG: hypothetical protein LC739_01515 [Actinobacteria bacterium]|nr:hypothetical protein [Actinomycetota bacterium]